MKKFIKLFLLLIFTASIKNSDAQTVIDFKLKVEKNNFIGYEKLDLTHRVCKGDSIFGIDQNEGCVVSYNKGFTFQKIDFSKQNLEELNNNNWYFELGNSISDRQNGRENVFLKGNNIILYNIRNNKFYESKDWINFSKIDNNNSRSLPEEAYKKGSYCHYIYFFNNECYFVNLNNTEKYSIYKSSDLKNWEQLIIPQCIDFINLNFYKNDLYLFTNSEKDNNVLYKYSNSNWSIIKGFSFKIWDGMIKESVSNIHFFNDKIFFKNPKPLIFNLKNNTYDEVEFGNLLTSCVYNDNLYYTTYGNKKLMSFYNAIDETNIEFPKPLSYICDVYKDYILVDGIKTIIKSNVDSKLLYELALRNEESKYWVEKKQINSNSSEIDRKLSKLVYQNQHPLMDKLIPLKKTPNGNEISYSPYFMKSSFESKRYVVSSKVNNITTIKQIHLVNAKSINIFNNKYVTYKIKDYDVYRGDAPYFDEYNRDCDFNLKTVGTHVQTTSRGNEINFFKAQYNETENCIDKIIFPIMETFEYVINGNIETFRIKSFKGGNEIFGFIAETEYKKNIYLFTYDIVNSKLQVTNLSGVEIKDYYRYNIKDCTLNKIFRTSDLNRYAFLQFRDKIVPLLISKSPSPIFAENAEMNAGIVDEFKFNGWSGNIIPLYADTSKEIVSFANYYSDNNEIAKLNSTIKVYDKKLNLIFEKNIIGTKITSVYKYKNHLIVGGFSVDKGYVGFPNPRIVVVNMATKNITYDKVILQKNGKVENISSDSNGNIEITTSIWSKNWNHSRNLDLESFIIFDRLEENGLFKNNLFESN
jgi:hypothetical protein